MQRLNLKIIAFIFIFFYILVEYLSYNFYKNLIIKDAKREIVSILNTVNAIREYVENVQKPVFYRLKSDGKLYQDFFDPKVLSSSYITRNIFEKYAKENFLKYNTLYKYKLAATNPLNPKNRADKFEEKILNRFRKNEIKEFSSILKENGKDYFYTAIPIERNKQSCLVCHGDPSIAPKEMVKIYGTKSGFHEKVGDLRAMISLKIPISNIIKAHIKDFIVGSIMAFVVLVILYILIYLFYKKDLELQKEKSEKEKILERINLELKHKVDIEVQRNLKKQEELYEKERLLEHQSKLAAMGEMIGNIAHQWRQPLTHIATILIELELMFKKNVLSKEQFSKKIDDIDEQISYMSSTIDDFRNFFSKEKESVKFNISTVIDKIKRLLQGTFYKHGIKLTIAIKDDFEMEGYPNEIAQAMLNILSNAKDIFIDRKIKNANIKISIFIYKGKKIILIKDNAGGIKTNPIDKIFEPYYSTKHASVGTGIGLYMTKMVIEKNNNGKICVKNTRNGAKFIIIF